MNWIETKLQGVYILEPHVLGDSRGYFMETYSQRDFAMHGLSVTFVQSNQSFTTKKGTLRGIHFQTDPMAQAKLVHVVQGAVLDVAVDLRRGSPTYLRWVSVEISKENKRMVYLPRGFGHGFITLTNDVVFCYQVDQPYSKEHDRGIRWNDPTIGIQWGIECPILSEKDRHSPLLAQSDVCFMYVE